MNKTNCQHCSASISAKSIKRHEQECYLNPNRTVDYRCNYCNKTFSQQCNLQRHVEVKHEKKTKPIAKCDSDAKEAKHEFYTVSTRTIDSPKLNASQAYMTITLTPAGLQKAAEGNLDELVGSAIEKELKPHRNNKKLGQLVLDTPSLDYPVSSGLMYLDELDVPQFMKSIERVNQSERLVRIDEDKPYLHVSLYTRQPKK